MELYRKYRPGSFDDVVGMEITIKSLKKELENGSHVFLMSGPAGCGKTTLARIMAKEVGANELGIREINSAENRGIDTAREILEQMRYCPVDGKALVWILDEVHMITNAGQNAFLKALEEVPETVYFFLCTTNPEKLIEPLKTRCSNIVVRPLNDNEMEYLLKRTSRKEGVKLSKDVFSKITELAQGSGRRGLKLLAKVISLDNDEERIAALNEAADSDGNAETIDLCRALSRNTDLRKLCELLKAVDVSDAEKVRQAVMGYMNACILKGALSNEIVATMQAFSSADTYRNGKFALTVALLDRDEML